MIMPHIYSSHHDQFIENYLSTLEPRILNSERYVVGKHKSGYVFALNLFVRVKFYLKLIYIFSFLSTFLLYFMDCNFLACLELKN